ncbi:unnamed protein product [Bursaphelenchus xylophilus]|uniref:Protein Wnt n=1 Tax=Bursaphelenchus xylophilus TaxID=6326 RepID=A0A1I7RM48_BURXY|nr:unnamed protein product [Bursaphelenchus xylophilus]CAG9118203.1 unnamed protein product [Bursaphelenchus xylophilus]
MIYTRLLPFFLFIHVVQAWWMLTQMASAPLPSSHYFDCNSLPGLSKKQLELCKHNPSAMRAVANGLKDAVDECQTQFSNEKWNCSAKHGFGTALLNIASRESAYVYALSAGAVSHSVAKACAKGLIPDCGCGDRPRQPAKDFIWSGCSDNLKYGNQFSRRFVDITEKRKLDSRAKMNLHNNRVGRKVLASSMKTKCKCHGVSGSCVTKTCWKVVPDIDEFAKNLKIKYERAQQVTVTPDSNELIVRTPPAVSRTERYIAQPAHPYKVNAPTNQLPQYEYQLSTMPANRADLVFLEDSPDYCEIDPKNEIGGTRGRECANDKECDTLCCGRGYDTKYEWQTEPCHCRFEWCCEVKCQQCERLVERRFCR